MSLKVRLDLVPGGADSTAQAASAATATPAVACFQGSSQRVDGVCANSALHGMLKIDLRRVR